MSNRLILPALRSILPGVIFAALAVVSASAQSVSDSPNSHGFFNFVVHPGFRMIADPLLTADRTIGTLMQSVPDGTIFYKQSADGTGNLGPVRDADFMDLLKQAASAGDRAAVRIRLEDGKPVLEWNGTLEEADSLQESFHEVAGATSPMLINPDRELRFWRINAESASNSNSVATESPAFVASVFTDGEWSDPTLTLDRGSGAILFNPTDEPFTVTFVGEIQDGEQTNPIPAGLSIRSSLIPRNGPITSAQKLRLNAGDTLIRIRGRDFEQFTVLPDGTWSPSEPAIDTGEAFFLRLKDPVEWTDTIVLDPAS